MTNTDNKCKRCLGLLVECKFMDPLAGMFYFFGVKCVNCGGVVFDTAGVLVRDERRGRTRKLDQRSAVGR